MCAIHKALKTHKSTCYEVWMHTHARRYEGVVISLPLQDAAPRQWWVAVVSTNIVVCWNILNVNPFVCLIVTTCVCIDFLRSEFFMLAPWSHHLTTHRCIFYPADMSEEWIDLSNVRIYWTNDRVTACQVFGLDLPRRKLYAWLWPGLRVWHAFLHW